MLWSPYFRADMVNLEVISCLDVPSLGGTFCDILSFD